MKWNESKWNTRSPCFVGSDCRSVGWTLQHKELKAKNLYHCSALACQSKIPLSFLSYSLSTLWQYRWNWVSAREGQYKTRLRQSCSHQQGPQGPSNWHTADLNGLLMGLETHVCSAWKQGFTSSCLVECSFLLVDAGHSGATTFHWTDLFFFFLMNNSQSDLTDNLSNTHTLALHNILHCSSVQGLNTIQPPHIHRKRQKR